MNAFTLIKPYFIANRVSILLGLLSLMLVDVLQLFIPRVIKRAVDDLTAGRTDPQGLLHFAMAILGIALVIAVFRYLWRRFLIGTSRVIEKGLREQLFSHIQTLSADYFNRTRTGDLMAHATNDINHIRMATGMGLVALTDALFLGTAAIAFMLYINVQLTLLAILPMPLIVISTRILGRKMHRHYQAVQNAFSVLTETAREQFAGIRIVKAFNLQEHAVRAFEQDSRKYAGQSMALVRVTGALFPLMIFFSNLSVAIVVWIGGGQTIAATITPGDFVAFINYLALLTWPMMALGWVVNLIQRGKASLDRVADILSTAPEIADRSDVQDLENSRGRITFEDVSFRYSRQNGDALHHIAFDLSAGRTLGIVGPPGSGKTSLIHLIPRLFDPVEGTVSMDGIELREIRLRSMRNAVSHMPQEPFLSSGTIRENITLGDPEISQARLLGVIQKACLDDILQTFPAGLDTVVGEKGVTLSGGQKQRVALARCLLNDAPVLLLDDPISQVDTHTGATIVAGLTALAGSKTLIIASHRLTAVGHADIIFVMQDGMIIDRGSHEELTTPTKSEDYYARTLRLQTIEESLHVG